MYRGLGLGSLKSPGLGNPEVSLKKTRRNGSEKKNARERPGLGTLKLPPGLGNPAEKVYPKENNGPGLGTLKLPPGLGNPAEKVYPERKNNGPGLGTLWKYPEMKRKERKKRKQGPAPTNRRNKAWKRNKKKNEEEKGEKNGEEEGGKKVKRKWAWEP
jgi:hypothetical protein